MKTLLLAAVTAFTLIASFGNAEAACTGDPATDNCGHGLEERMLKRQQQEYQNDQEDQNYGTRLGSLTIGGQPTEVQLDEDTQNQLEQNVFASMLYDVNQSFANGSLTGQPLQVSDCMPQDGKKRLVVTCFPQGGEPTSNEVVFTFRQVNTSGNYPNGCEPVQPTIEEKLVTITARCGIMGHNILKTVVITK